MADNKPGFAFAPKAPREVSEFLKNKGIRPSFSWADVAPEEHAVAFSVAKAMQADVLNEIKSALQSALDDGKTFDQFKKELRPQLIKRGWWGRKEQMDPVTGKAREVTLGTPRRLKTIWDANMRAARTAGQWERIMRTKRALPYLLYCLGASERHRPHHAAKAGLVLPVDDPFWLSWYPPNGWGCKCHVRQITRVEAERRGISDSPEIPMRDWLNPRTGEITRIASGVDPAWQGNPGAYRLARMNEFLDAKLNSIDPHIAQAAARDAVRSKRFAQIMKGEASGATPIAILSPQLQSALGAETRVVKFSSDTAAKQRAHHPELVQEDYLRVADLIARGHARIQETQNLILLEAKDLPWIAVIKATRARDELFLTTLYRIASSRYLKRLHARTRPVE